MSYVHPRRKALSIATAFFAATALAATPLAPAVAASGPCALDGAALTVSLSPTAPRSTISADGGYLELNGVPCPQAPLGELDRIQVDDAAGHDAALTLNAPAGGFRNADRDEISWSLALGDGTDSAIIQGASGANRIKARGNRANLNSKTTSTDDVVVGGAESFELRGGAGDDRLGIVEGTPSAPGTRYSSSAASLGTYPSARIFGGSGNDTLRGDDNVNVIWAGDGDDTVFARAGDDEVQGGPGNDTLFGGDGDDLLNGGAGNDSEYGGGNTDLFQQADQDVYTSATPVSVPDVGKGLSHIDVPPTDLSAIDVNVRVYIDHPAVQDLWVTLITPWNNRVRLSERRGSGNAFNGTQFDSEAFTNIKTATGNFSGRFHPEWSMELAQGPNPTGRWTLWVEDKVTGSVGAIKGWELELGMPTSEGNGADTLRGEGSANDLVVYSQRTTGVTASLDGGSDDGQLLEGDSLGFATTCPADFPSGSQCSDLEWAYGGTGDDEITGTDLVNDLRGASGHDTITALGGTDQIRGANGQDVISAGWGNDAIHGQANPDTIDGGDGFDRVIYGYSSVGMEVDISNQQAGWASDGEAGGDDDTLTWIEHITGTSKADTIIGNERTNIFFAAQGDDFLDGNAGNDTLDGNADTDTCLDGETNTGCENTTPPPG